MKIGIALSGGGIRATVYHLGIFKYLAEIGCMEKVAHISSVSGASLCVGLVFAENNYKWPTSAEFTNRVLSAVMKTILSNNIEFSAIVKLVTSLKWFGNQAGLMGQTLHKKWNIRGTLQDLPDFPHWDINTTAYETGKDFMLNKKYIGDYKSGYTPKPAFPLADAMAASAGFPILIGPLKLDTGKYNWFEDIACTKPKKAEAAQLHLWDGGVYDNLGLESLYKPDHLSDDIDYLVICNASAPISFHERESVVSPTNLTRLLNIAMDQVCSLRTRYAFTNVILKGNGQYMQIGNSAAKIAAKSTVSDEVKKKLINECMSEDLAKYVENYATTLTTPNGRDFDLILRHGYENAKCEFTFYPPSNG